MQNVAEGVGFEPTCPKGKRFSSFEKLLLSPFLQPFIIIFSCCKNLLPQGFFYFSVSSNSSQDDVFDLKVTAKLNAFNVFVCDQKCNIADIRIHGK